MALPIALPGLGAAALGASRTTRASAGVSAEWTLEQERKAIERALHGRYRLDELLARGGMGSIWRAWEPGLERSVAIKVLAPSRARDQDDRGRFRREARILASLAHPGIVPVFGLGDDADVCWFAMPCIGGGTLADRLAAKGRLSFDEARAFLIQLAGALDHAHRRGIHHRDVKPDNVLLDQTTGRAVLADFGIATVTTSDHSRSEIVRGFGTPDYMAPEQILGEQQADGRSDLYALGVIGFQMVTGRMPFTGTTQSEIAAQHLVRPCPTVSSYATGIPDDLASAIDRCLEKDPARRWPDGLALATALSSRSIPSRSLTLATAWAACVALLRHRNTMMMR